MLTCAQLLTSQAQEDVMVWDELVERRGARKAAESERKDSTKSSPTDEVVCLFVYSSPSVDVSVCLGELRL